MGRDCNMGLDMNLYGTILHWSNMEKPEGERRPMRDGFEITETRLELGYWRKHPNLHGYIVQTFANGVDDCRNIDLQIEAINQIIQAVKEHKLPHTDGFFFGESDGSEDAETIDILEKAKAWCQTTVKHEYKSMFYRASW